LSNAHCIAGLEEFKRQLGIQDNGIKLVACWNITTTLHQFVLCVYSFCRSFGFVANHVFKNYDVAGLSN